MEKFKYRKWQEEHFKSFLKQIEDGFDHFHFEATPGSGKTLLAVRMAKHLLDDRSVDFVVVIVPWDSIRGNEFGGMVKAFDSAGVMTHTDLYIKKGARVVRQPNPSGRSFIVTYSGACRDDALELLEDYKNRRGLRFAVVFDEVHHTTTHGGTWGDFADRINVLAEFTISMSGTWFRSDGGRILFIEYDAEDKPILSCPGYTYERAVSDGVVRPVAFDYIDPTMRGQFEDADKEEHFLLSETPSGSQKRFRSVKDQVLDVRGECVRSMIEDASKYLEETRAKFPDAGVLFTCRPSKQNGSEDYYVREVSDLIRRMTREEVVCVTSHDRNADGRLESFRNGRQPFLVAVNKVSEGCDIPRLRGVAMLRYTDSEMLFRQIVGRALRYTDNEDGTAAMVFMPKFPVMYQFALNMFGESAQGIRNFMCDTCGQYPCECPCTNCHENPCVCVPEDWPPPLDTPDYHVLDIQPEAGGGSVGTDDVQERSIALAKEIKQNHITHRHSNEVQLGHVIQLAMQSNGEGAERSPDSPLAELGKIKRRVLRLMGQIVKRFYGGDWQAAWVDQCHRRHGVDWKTAQVTWTNEKLYSFIQQLEDTIRRGNR